MKRFIPEFFNGIGYFFKAFPFIFRHRLFKWILLPGILNIFLFVVIVSSAWFSADRFTDWAVLRLDWNADNGWIRFVNNLVDVLLTGIAVVIYVLLYKHIVLNTLGPLMGGLVERIEKIKGFELNNQEEGNFIHDFLRGIRLSLRNIVRELGLTGLLLLFGLVPVVGIASPVFIFLVQAYFVGFGMMDYTLERRQVDAPTSISTVRRHRGFAVGNGAGFLLMMFIPVVGWLFAPAMTLTAATLGVLENKYLPESVKLELEGDGSAIAKQIDTSSVKNETKS